jgi:hypothetical protein
MIDTFFIPKWYKKGIKLVDFRIIQSYPNIYSIFPLEKGIRIQRIDKNTEGPLAHVKT